MTLPDAWRVVSVGEIARHLPVIGAGRVHQQQRVARRGGVQHHEGAARLRDDAREGVEDRDLLGAGRAQVLQQQRAPFLVEMGAARGHDLVDVALRLGLRVDAVDAQARQVPGHRHGQVGRGIGRAQVDVMPALDQADGQRGGDRGLADAALAHDHDQPVPRAASSSIRRSSPPRSCGSEAGGGPSPAGRLCPVPGIGPSSARRAGRPTMSKGRSGTVSVASLRRAPGIAAKRLLARCPPGTSR